MTVSEILPGSHSEDYDMLLTTSRIASIRFVDELPVPARSSSDTYLYGRWAQHAEGLMYQLDKHQELRLISYRPLPVRAGARRANLVSKGI